MLGSSNLVDETNSVNWSREGGGGAAFFKPNARLPPSGVTACGVLWVEPGDPMTRRPSSIVLNLALLHAYFCDRRHSSS